MEIEMLVKKINEIELTVKMQERIVNNCYKEADWERKGIGEKGSRRRSMQKKKSVYKRLVVLAAMLVLCICMTGVTTLAVTGKLQGYFEDVKRWDGAVVGTTYQQASDEISITISNMSEETSLNKSDEITVEVVMLNPAQLPYSVLQTVSIQEYQILDKENNVVWEGEVTEEAEVVDGKATITLITDQIPAGEYRLVISKLSGGSKADQPLPINGYWGCDLIRK